MIKQMGAAGLAVEQAHHANYYRWEDPSSNITVCLNFDAANRLQGEVLDAVGELPGVGHEIGGILLGRTECEDGRSLTVIEDFDLVPCTHSDGPYYSLSAKDHLIFRAMLLARSKSEGTEETQQHSVLGYCRSHDRENLYLSADDLSIIQTHFDDPANIFLVLKPMMEGACRIGFFSWNGSEIQPRFTGREIALMPRVAPLEVAPHPVEQAEDTLEPGERRPPARTVWRLGAAALGAVAAGALFGVLTSHRPGPPVRSNNPAALTAPKLTASGPTIPDVPVPDVPADAGPRATPVPQSVARGTRAAGQKRAHTEVASPRGGVRHRSIPASPATHAAPHRVEAPPQIAVTTPPATEVAKATTPVATPIVKPTVIAETPPVAKDLPPVAREQAQSVVPAPPAPIAQRAANSPPAATSFIGPRIIHHAVPVIPLGVAPKITTDVQIDVNVAIDERGKVTVARVTSTRGAAAGLLRLEALKAAQLFRFRPALRNNHAIRSEMVLTFRIAAKNR